MSALTGTPFAGQLAELDARLARLAASDDAEAPARAAEIAVLQAAALAEHAGLAPHSEGMSARQILAGQLAADRATLARIDTAEADPETALRALDHLAWTLAWRAQWFDAVHGRRSPDDPAAAAAEIAAEDGPLPEDVRAAHEQRRRAAALARPMSDDAVGLWRQRHDLQGRGADAELVRRRAELADAAEAALANLAPAELPAVSSALARQHLEALQAGAPTGAERQRVALDRAEDAARLAAALRTASQRADLEPAAAKEIARNARAAARTEGALRDDAAEEELHAALVRRLGAEPAERLRLAAAWASAVLVAALLGEALAVRLLGAVPLALSALEGLAGAVVFVEVLVELWMLPAGRRVTWRRAPLDLLFAMPWSLLFPALAANRGAAPALARLARLAWCAVRVVDRFAFRHRVRLDRAVLLGVPPEAEADYRQARQALDALADEVSERRAAWRTRLTPEQAECRQAARVAFAQASAPAAAAWTTPAPTPIDDVVDRLIGTSAADVAPSLAGWRGWPAKLAGMAARQPWCASLPGAAEVAAAAPLGPPAVAAAVCREAGRALHHAVDSAHAALDLVGSAPAPAVADRVGAAIVGATAGPARRLAYLFAITVVAYGITAFVPLPEFIDKPLEKTLKSASAFVLGLGLACAAPLAFGVWLRRRARRTEENFERVVEAQYAAQTKATKLARRAPDSVALAARVAAPELALRIGDDVQPGAAKPRPRTLDPAALAGVRAARAEELGFVRLVDLLYADYLDGSPFHRSDTKVANQLRGNLAFQNLASQAGDAREAERVAAALERFSGPQWWFALVNRALTQETAKLLLDYNRHAIPRDRLAAAPESARAAHRDWLARRGGVAPEAVELPPPSAAPHPPPIGPHGPALPRFETVEFAATDFLLDDPERDAELRARFGQAVADLVARDRREVVRRVFRTPHAEGAAAGAANLHAWRRRRWANGRALLLPFAAAAVGFALLRRGFLAVRRLVREMVASEVAAPAPLGHAAYADAVRKIHRMRKPVFLHALWLRARHDPEYLGDAGGAAELQADLDFIDATRLDRVRLAALRRRRADRLRRSAVWLRERGFAGAELRALLARQYPHLAQRSAEVERALRMAFSADADGMFSLGAALEGLRAVAATALAGEPIPADLPPPVKERPEWLGPVRLWRRIVWRRRLFALPEFRGHDFFEQQKIVAAILLAWPRTRAWVLLLVDPGWPDPEAEFRARLHATALRTELWSDQLVALRTVQTLTGLEIQHYAELVRDLGAYAELGPAVPPTFGVPAAGG